MTYLTNTTAGRVTWGLSFAGIIAGIVGIAALMRLGDVGFAAHWRAKLVFPIAVAAYDRLGSFWDVPLLLLFFQFPIYSAVLGLALARDRFREAAVCIVLVHGVVAAVCFLT